MLPAVDAPAVIHSLGRRDAHEIDIEWNEPFLDLLTDPTDAEQQYPAPRKAGVLPMRPAPVSLGQHGFGQTAQAGQDEGEGQFPGGGLVHFDGVAVGEPGRQGVGDAVEPERLALYDAEAHSVLSRGEGDGE